ncbi:hypothetical protein G6N82_04625 [Altererythrobacter sp. BO-6]|uniref:right-handed parallel beta-helix repeat-containing protein n=1 Tax=Altererythrobacter sp. BO-6 TaxID=2604537 RepID=UPI0013E1B8E7|nr:right-handed parallel beta-helix repeat-containing protein [Altererythrobacter sp. BO-6]QIG53524.1 hypothetical protein G6N82_04625 [Altererythrobacter sp. BO-6]
MNSGSALTSAFWAVLFALLSLAQSPGLRGEEPGKPGTSYFVSSAGDDQATGESPSQAWRTLERVSEARFDPGDRVLFRAGDTFPGQLRIRSSGAPGMPLVFAHYGQGSKPVIDGGATSDGQFASAIAIWNQQYIEISDLEIANDVRRALPGEPKEASFGISLLNSNGGKLEHFRFRNLTIRDIFAERLSHEDEQAFNRVRIAGIRISTISAGGKEVPSYFRDVVIEDSHFERSGRFGVMITHDGAGEGYRDAHTRDPDTEFNRDIVIRNNRFFDMGGSAVLLSGARMVLVENNDFTRTGSSLVPARMVGRGSGAWVFNSAEVVAQHNRSNHVRGYKDSYGMHVDFGNRDILYQYNFSHDSEGGFVEILGRNRNIIWRYNISVNDGLREKVGNTLWLSPFSRGTVPSDEIYIYNNTVFVRPGLYPDLDFRARRICLEQHLLCLTRSDDRRDDAARAERRRARAAGQSLFRAGKRGFSGTRSAGRSDGSALRRSRFERGGGISTARWQSRAGWWCDGPTSAISSSGAGRTSHGQRSAGG